jgi:TolB-like protein/DNA-binding winged helix-turn-helix (wHTH) protein/Flp pilus assembly protein TadD
MAISTQRSYGFGPFRLDPPERVLLRDGQAIPLPPKAYDVLVTLVTRAGHLVTKEELLKEVWAGTFVEEANLSYTVSILRKVLGDDSEPWRYIETVPKRGYRFRAPIVLTQSGPMSPMSAPVTAERLPLRNLPRGWRIAGAVVGAFALLALIIWQIAKREPGQPRITAEIRSVAILPLKGISNDPSQDYFVEGMHEALITELARAGPLAVVARTSAMRYADTDKPLATIAKELNVQAIVEGSVVRAGKNVRIDVRLVDATNGVAVWADSFDRQLLDVLSLHAEVAQAIAREILSASRNPAAPPRRTKQIDPDAYEEYLRGRYHLNLRGETNLLKAVDHFTNAIRRDPRYALAHAGLADARNLLPLHGSIAPRDVVPLGKAAALAAIALDDSLAEGHASLAWASLTYDWDWTTADREFKRAIALNPSYPIARMWYGESLVWRGRSNEGVAELRRARELDPVSQVLLQNMAAVYYFVRNYESAIRETESLLQLDPGYAEAYIWQGLAKLQNGMREQAIPLLERGLALDPDRPLKIGRLAYGYSLAGQRKAASEGLARLTSISRERYVSAINFATIWIGLGDTGKALEWLEKGVEERATEMIFLKTDPRFDPLRSEVRFQQVLRRMNFPN